MEIRASKASLGLGIAVAAWSLSPLLIFESKGLADAPILALYAVALGSALTWLTLAISGRLHWAVSHQGEKRTWLIEAALVGLAAFVAYPLLYFSAIQSGPPTTVNLVNYLWPVVAVIVVAVWRPASRSLETALAAGFGFAGAGLAIAAGVGVDRVTGHPGVTPYVLSALGALTYGAASGAIRIRHSVDREDSLGVFTSALLFGGVVAALILGALRIVRPDLVSIHLGGRHAWALVAYAVLLPIAHLSWMSSVRDPRIPAFAAAFLVPVISTGILAAVVTGVARPEVLSALVLVLCGITFASLQKKGIPVGYAVTLAFLASIQISQVLAGRVAGEVNNETYTVSELIAAIVAVFAGFVLSNAIGRYGALQRCCGNFYSRASNLLQSEPEEVVLGQLDTLDAFVISGERHDSEAMSGASRPLGHEQFAKEWADVELAASNSVSDYEWLVLLIGGGGLLIALHAYAIDSVSAFTVLLRAFAVSLIVGVLFAIRDYDHHRPRRLCVLLSVFRRGYDIPIGPESPLAVGVEYWSQPDSRALQVGLAALVLVAIVAITVNI
jgi:drug/metabolite transporter (DMT)-like permease